MSLTENIKRNAEQYGISIRKLEQVLHLANKSIAAWDEHRPSVDKVADVAAFFGVTVDSLLDRGSAYSEDETALIAKFRRLTASQRENILNNIDFLLSQNPVKKEAVM